MATYGEYITLPGLLAYATLASSQYYLVQLASTAGYCKVGTSATSKIVGVVMNDPAAGEPAEIACIGIAKVAAEASVSIGDALTCSATGRAKATTTDGNWVIGRAIDASATAGNLIRVILKGAADSYEFA